MTTVSKKTRILFRKKSRDRSPNNCRRVRAWLYKAVNRCLRLDVGWVQNHIANCPRCQRRFVNVGKVDLALSALKSQPHRLDLLMRANTQAIGVLKHSLREAPKAEKLKHVLPEPTLLEACGKYTHSTANIAACVATLFLMKIGIFSSVDKFQTQGREVFKQYYTYQVGEDLADEVFSA